MRTAPLQVEERKRVLLSPIEAQEPEERKQLTWLGRIKLFLAEVKQEMKMVSWPMWSEVRSSVAIVLIFVFLLSVYIYVVDQVCEQLREWIMSRP